MKLGIYGHPVAHSLSPSMHAAWLRAAGIEGTYERFLLPVDATGTELREHFDEHGLHGVNVTIPFKERVLEVLDRVSDEAARIGAVNTLVQTASGIRGTNTDAPGFLASIASEPVGRAVVLGAGGSARAVVAALCGAGWDVCVLNRTVLRAEGLAHAFGAAAGSLQALRAVAPTAGLIVSTLSAGHPHPIGVEPDTLWYDLNYGERALPFREVLAKQGVRTVDGLDMLIHQGALAFQSFTGVAADPEIGREALERVESERHMY